MSGPIHMCMTVSSKDSAAGLHTPAKRFPSIPDAYHSGLTRCCSTSRCAGWEILYSEEIWAAAHYRPWHLAAVSELPEFGQC